MPVVTKTSATFSDRLKSLRNKHRLTLQQLGDASGISQQGVWNYENRGDEPSASILFSLADALGVDGRWLLSGVGSGEIKAPVLPPDVIHIAWAIFYLSPERKKALAVLMGVELEQNPSPEIHQNGAAAEPGSFPDQSKFDETATYSERLRWAMERARMSQSDVARAVGVEPQSIQYLCDRTKHAQGSNFTAQIAAATNVSAYWLETGKNPPGTPIAKEKD